MVLRGSVGACERGLAAFVGCWFLMVWTLGIRSGWMPCPCVVGGSEFGDDASGVRGDQIAGPGLRANESFELASPAVTDAHGGGVLGLTL